MEGARTFTGGKKGEDLFFEPTVLVDLPQKAPMDVDDETFGPGAALIRFESEDEAVEKANEDRVGLGAYIFSRDVNRCWHVGEALEVSMVGIKAAIDQSGCHPLRRSQREWIRKRRWQRRHQRVIG